VDQEAGPPHIRVANKAIIIREGHLLVT